MHIVFAVVVYNIRPDQSSTLRTLANCLPRMQDCRWHVLIFDNSAHPVADVPDDIVHCTAVWAGFNRGLAQAYNDALAFCTSRGAQVLVTLDQDSEIIPAYISALRKDSEHLHGSTVALCPEITSANRVISPFATGPLGRKRYGRTVDPPAAINSFSAYSVQSLVTLGGFEEFYWLDALDLSTYARLARGKMKVRVMDVRVEHNLSLLSGTVGAQRWKNIAYYEACFLFQYAGRMQAIAGLARLLARAVRIAPRGALVGYVNTAVSAILKGAVAGSRRRDPGPRAFLK
jgi:glycosyltransferase involved in cell wall biosynthesis